MNAGIANITTENPTRFRTGALRIKSRKTEGGLRSLMARPRKQPHAKRSVRKGPAWTPVEWDRLVRRAREHNLDPSIFIHSTVMARIDYEEDAEAADLRAKATASGVHKKYDPTTRRPPICEDCPTRRTSDHDKAQ